MQCDCGHALLVHADVKDPKSGEVTKYAGPCMARVPADTKSDGKMNNNAGNCPCPAGRLAIEL